MLLLPARSPTIRSADRREKGDGAGKEDLHPGVGGTKLIDHQPFFVRGSTRRTACGAVASSRDVDAKHLSPPGMRRDVQSQPLRGGPHELAHGGGPPSMASVASSSRCTSCGLRARWAKGVWSIHRIGQSGGGRLAHNTIASQDPDGLQFPVPVPRPLFGRYAGCCPTAWPGDLEVVGGLKGVTVLQAEASSADGEG